mgnify:CR=1 FL=1
MKAAAEGPMKGALCYTDEQVASNVEEYKTTSFLLSGLQTLFPLVLLVLGFVAFRVLDILKPPPARQLERLPGGWGIVADDLIAAAYAGLVVWGGSTLNSGLTGT